MDTDETLQILRLALEVFKLLMTTTETATNEKILKAREEIKEAMKDWA